MRIGIFTRTNDVRLPEILERFQSKDNWWLKCITGSKIR